LISVTLQYRHPASSNPSGAQSRIDVTFISAFGQTIPNVISPKFEMVKCDDVTIRQRFNKSYESQIAQNRTMDRANAPSSFWYVRHSINVKK